MMAIVSVLVFMLVQGRAVSGSAFFFNLVLFSLIQTVPELWNI